MEYNELKNILRAFILLKNEPTIILGQYIDEE